MNARPRLLRLLNRPGLGLSVDVFSQEIRGRHRPQIELDDLSTEALDAIRRSIIVSRWEDRSFRRQYMTAPASEHLTRRM